MDKGHILIVDDEEVILSSLEDILEDEGYRVEKANSGENALDLIRSESPDVVLVDVWMPGIDGIKTLQAVKEFCADTEVIVMSGHGNIDTAVTATKLGAFDFVEKPLSMESVLRVVNQALQKKRADEERVAEESLRLEGADPKIAEVRSLAEEASRDRRPVVVWGERGTGKRFVARMIHARGVTQHGPFTPIHCGAFLGAGTERVNETARRLLPKETGGTIQIVGIEVLEAELRFAVLDALMAGGKRKERLILSIETSPDPSEDMGSLTSELGEYLLARNIGLPALRERRGDILPLAKRFLADGVGRAGGEKEIDAGASAVLFQYDWPGNLAELKGVMNKASSTCAGRTIGTEHLPASMLSGFPQEVDSERRLSFKEARREWERKFLSCHLIYGGWDVESVAERLEMPANTLRRKLRAHHLEPPVMKEVPAGRRQRTIGKSVVLYGRGLHSGLKTGLILEPLPPDSGIRFGSLTTEETVAARVGHVENTDHATNLRAGAVVARTIEHLMSALHTYGVTNTLVKIGEEVPIMDGSAVDFCNLIESAGVLDQEGEVAPLVVDKVYEVGEADSAEGYIRIEPAEGFLISYLLDYPPPIGRQSHTYRHTGPKSFRKEIAPARTFSFISELETLERMGLGEGGRWGNVILVDDERVVNTDLRFENEFARHKILDIVGDLYLLGRPIQGKVTAERSGHRHNVALVRSLQEALL